jgi:polyphosphate kinase
MTEPTKDAAAGSMAHLPSQGPEPVGELERAALERAAKVLPIPQPDQPIPMFNREFSWIEFNRRVLAEAQDPTVPLLERLKFLSICASNLDEFFMVRAGGVHALVSAGISEKTHDGLTPKQQMKGIRERTKRLMLEMHATFNEQLVPELRKAGIRIENFADLPRKDTIIVREHYDANIAPILTPLAHDPGHPFPFLANLALNIALVLESDRGEEHIVFLKVPPLIPRFMRIPETNRFVPVGSIIAGQAERFFPGLRIKRVVPFRVIRNADIAVREDEVQDLLTSVESEIRRRDRREIVRLEIDASASDSLVTLLTSSTQTSPDDVFYAPGMLKMGDLMQIYTDVKQPSLREQPFNPRIPMQLATSDDIFSIIQKGDILLHRPYDSFTAVVEFVQAAADDADVVAIKQTLYRTDEGSPIVEALAKAALAGKQVTAVVELQARFDEMKNIAWARRLEDAGVQVVYGLLGIKTHCKVCIVVRREGAALQRYTHLSTGNYNAKTARLYTDIDLFTRDEGIGEDAAQALNLITGFSIQSAQEIFEHQGPSLQWKRLVVSPIDYHSWTIRMIEREIAHAHAGRPSGIVAKMNALVDPIVIQRLYDASRAGVRIDLIVRGICCLQPGVPGLSENIRVSSVIDRFLEHSRIFLFRNGGESEIFVASGDWMPRNFFRRFEMTYPILSEPLKNRVEHQILDTFLADNTKAWRLQSDGTYKKRAAGAGAPAVRSQERFIEIARSEAVRLGPYEEIIRKPGSARRKAKKLKKKEKARP